MKNYFELLRLMRSCQWVNNAFVFAGLLFGHACHDSHHHSKGQQRILAMGRVSIIAVHPALEAVA